jgi:hypothetical protein
VAPGIFCLRKEILVTKTEAEGLENRQWLAIIIFALLLAAGLDYTGRSMHQALGGDKKFYAFILPDVNNRRLILCGNSYDEYQAAAVWNRLAGFTFACVSELASRENQTTPPGGQGIAAAGEISPARSYAPARPLSPWSRAWSFLKNVKKNVKGLAAILLKYLIYNLKEMLLSVWNRLRDLKPPFWG